MSEQKDAEVVEEKNVTIKEEPEDIVEEDEEDEEDIDLSLLEDDDEDDEDDEDEMMDIGEILVNALETPDGETVCTALCGIKEQLEIQNKILVKILKNLS